MNERQTTSAEFFDAKYRASADPWNFSADPYEQARYGTILSALGGRRYRRAWEPGCSIGALTVRLAEVCDHVEACDLSETAARLAEERCRDLPNVHVRCAPVTDLSPVGECDLILLSEIGYYKTAEDWAELARGVVDRMQPGATLLASHWLGFSPDHLLSGDQVHDELMRDTRLVLQQDERHAADRPEAGTRGFLRRWRTPRQPATGFRLNLWRRS